MLGLSRQGWAVVGLTLVAVGCTSSGERSRADADETAPTSVAPATTGSSDASTDRDELRVSADLVRRFGGAAETTAPELVVEPPTGSALLAFPLIPASPECLLDATLVVQGTELPPITAWVSIETEAATFTDGQSLGQSVIVNGSPSASGVVEDDGATWDVTELYRWARNRQPDSGAFVVVLEPRFSGADPVTIGASESEAPARLRWTADQGCP